MRFSIAGKAQKRKPASDWPIFTNSNYSGRKSMIKIFKTRDDATAGVIDSFIIQ
jgi:hypothetical protein